MGPSLGTQRQTRRQLGPWTLRKLMHPERVSSSSSIRPAPRLEERMRVSHDAAFAGEGIQVIKTPILAPRANAIARAIRGQRAARVPLHQVGVDGDGGSRAGAGRGDHLRTRFGHVTGTSDTGHAGAPIPST